ncbi:MAG: hypothetical protein SF187_13785 [Deltaproteobacteria bacterium]|nr:hypothetical protein [Deltaproteobacteria bacterium]
MTWDHFDKAFRKHAKLARVETVDELQEGGRTFALLKASTPGERRLLVTAGFHGDEVAGPLTLLHHLPELVAYARERNVGLSVYPCINPSGFDIRTRYNVSGASPNNDFVRYRTQEGSGNQGADAPWVDSLKPGQTFETWRPFAEGPNETRLMAKHLAIEPTPQAMLDIHQDPWLARQACYAYVFGDRQAYRPLLATAHEVLPVATNEEVDDGLWSDHEGLIELHDGSITDLFWRRGTPFVATLETSTMAPLPACHAVNMIWLRGFVNLAGQSTSAT